MESATTPFPFFGAKRKITPPPPPFVKPPSPPSLPQHRRQFTRLQCFQAAQQKATKAPSVARFPRILSRRGAFHPHRCLSQWSDGRHFRDLHVRQSGKRLGQTQSSCEAPSLSFVLSRSNAFSHLHCVLRTRQRSEFAALQQRALPGGTTGIEGSSHWFKAWASNSSLSFTA